MGFLAALGGAGASIGETMLNNYYAKANAKQAYERQVRFAQNAHQWEVADLRKAGLNPILSAGGGGAHAPGVAMAAVPKTQNLWEAGQAGQHSARSNQILKAQLSEATSKANVASYEAEKADAKRKNPEWFKADILKDISTGLGQVPDKAYNATVGPIKSLFSSGAAKWAAEEAKKYYGLQIQQAGSRIKRSYKGATDAVKKYTDDYIRRSPDGSYKFPVR